MNTLMLEPEAPAALLLEGLDRWALGGAGSLLGVPPAGVIPVSSLREVAQERVRSWGPAVVLVTAGRDHELAVARQAKLMPHLSQRGVRPSEEASSFPQVCLSLTDSLAEAEQLVEAWSPTILLLTVPRSLAPEAGRLALAQHRRGARS